MNTKKLILLAALTLFPMFAQVGVFGVGRLASVDKITFSTGSKDSMDCK